MKTLTDLQKVKLSSPTGEISVCVCGLYLHTMKYNRSLEYEAARCTT